MISYSDNRILSDIRPYTVIVHQVDCQGNINAGIAKQINSMFSGWYQSYRSYCSWFKNGHEDEILGTFHRFEIPEKHIIICSVFGQKNSSKDFQIFNIEVWEKALKKILKQTERINFISSDKWTIHIQSNIGATKKTMVNQELIDLFKDLFSSSNNAELIIHQ